MAEILLLLLAIEGSKNNKGYHYRKRGKTCPVCGSGNIYKRLFAELYRCRNCNSGWR